MTDQFAGKREEVLGDRPLPLGRRLRESLVWSTTREVLRNPMGAVGLGVVVLLLVLGFAAPALTRYDPIAQLPGHKLAGPSAQFWFGTDELSRDLFSRTLYGLRASLLVSIVAVSTGGTLGIVCGFIAGYVRGPIEIVLMRLVDTMFAFPGLLLAIGLLSALGSSLQILALVLGVGAFPGFARLARAQMLAERSQDYVLAAKVVGASGRRIVFRHVALNALPPLFVHAALAMAGAVLVEASLGYLGIGIQPPQPSLGSLVEDARNYLGALHYIIFPGLCLVLLLLGLNLLADAVNESLDPHRRRR
jgi:peptide/nickel transport system permease protein